MRLRADLPLAMALSTFKLMSTPAKSARGYSCPISTYKVFNCGPLAWTSWIVDHNTIMTIVLVIDKAIIMKAIHSRYCFAQSQSLLGIPRQNLMKMNQPTITPSNWTSSDARCGCRCCNSSNQVNTSSIKKSHQVSNEAWWGM